MLSMDEIKLQVSEHQDILVVRNKYLRALEKQQAAMGVHTPAHIVTEIDDYRTKISDLETDVIKLLERELQPRVSEYDAFASMLSVIGNDAASAWIFQGVIAGLSYHNILATPFYIGENPYVLKQMQRNVENECRQHMVRLGNEIEELKLLLPD